MTDKEILDEGYAGYLDNEARLTEAEKHGLPTLDREEWERMYGEDVLRDAQSYAERHRGFGSNVKPVRQP